MTHISVNPTSELTPIEALKWVVEGRSLRNIKVSGDLDLVDFGSSKDSWQRRIDLSGCVVAGNLRIAKCFLASSIDMTGLQARSLTVQGVHLEIGENIILRSASIEAGLRISDCSLGIEGFVDLSLATVGGGVEISQLCAYTPEGQLRFWTAESLGLKLDGASIRGDLSLDSESRINRLSGTRLTVGGSILFHLPGNESDQRDGFDPALQRLVSLDLRGATIQGDLDVQGALFCRCQVVIEQARIAGSVYILVRKRAHQYIGPVPDDSVHLLAAGVDVQGRFQWIGGRAHGLNLAGARLADGMLLQGVDLEGADRDEVPHGVRGTPAALNMANAVLGGALVIRQCRLMGRSKDESPPRMYFGRIEVLGEVEIDDIQVLSKSDLFGGSIDFTNANARTFCLQRLLTQQRSTLSLRGTRVDEVIELDRILQSRNDGDAVEGLTIVLDDIISGSLSLSRITCESISAKRSQVGRGGMSVSAIRATKELAFSGSETSCDVALSRVKAAKLDLASFACDGELQIDVNSSVVVQAVREMCARASLVSEAATRTAKALGSTPDDLLRRVGGELNFGRLVSGLLSCDEGWFQKLEPEVAGYLSLSAGATLRTKAFSSSELVGECGRFHADLEKVRSELDPWGCYALIRGFGAVPSCGESDADSFCEVLNEEAGESFREVISARDVLGAIDRMEGAYPAYSFCENLVLADGSWKALDISGVWLLLGSCRSVGDVVPAPDGLGATIDARRVRVSGRFQLRGDRISHFGISQAGDGDGLAMTPSRVVLDLRHASIGQMLIVEPRPTPIRLGSADIEGWGLDFGAGVGVAKKLDEILRCDPEFQVNHYVRLEQQLENAGNSREADSLYVLWMRRRRKTLGPIAKSISWLHDVFVRYGTRRARLVSVTAALLLAYATTIAVAYGPEILRPRLDALVALNECGAPCDDYGSPDFATSPGGMFMDGLLLSLDYGVPVIPVPLKSAVEPIPGTWASYLSLALSLMGWVAWPIIVAGALRGFFPRRYK